MSDWAPDDARGTLRNFKRRLDRLERQTSPQAHEPGAVTLTVALAIPSGWILANGATLNRFDYKNLFDAIGTTYGAGNGTTTFVIPTMANVGPARYIIKA